MNDARETLSRLGSGGIRAIFSELDELAAHFESECLRSGDARFYFLYDCFSGISRWRSEGVEKNGGVSTDLLMSLDACLVGAVNEILNETDASIATRLAHNLQQEVDAYLLPAAAWEGSAR